MKVYLSYFKLRIMAMLQYRSAAIAGLTTQFFWGIMLIFIYMAMYEGNSNVGITLNQMVTYVWLGQAFYAALNVRNIDQEISHEVRSGSVAYEIIRPYNLYFWWYTKCMARRMAAGLLRFLPVIIIAVLLPKPYGISMPHSPLSFILFLISLFLGIFMVVALNMLVHTIGFYTYNEEGLRGMLNSVMEFLAGSYIPVVLLPIFLQKATYYLPFRLISDLPFRIYSNNIGINEGIFSVLLQLGWIIILITLGNLIVKRAMKKIFVQGG